MYYIQIIIPVILIFIDNIKAEYLSSKCNLDDSDCLVKTANEFIPVFAPGIPDLNVEPIDPLFIKYINATTPNLKFIVSNTTVTGLKDVIVKYMTYNKANSTLSIVYFSTYQVESEYEISGNLLSLPIEGEGLLHAKIRKLEIHLHLIFGEVKGSDGKTHWTVAYADHQFYMKDKSDFDFENLFDGNPNLAAAAKEIIARREREVLNEIGPISIRQVIDNIIVRIQELFKAIPSEELYIK